MKRRGMSKATEQRLRQAEQKAERERRKRAAILLMRYRTVAAAFVETDNEKLLREACENLDPFDEDEREEIYDEVMDAIDLPDTVSRLWAEYHEWEKLIDDRLTFDPDYDAPDGILYRLQLLEDLLDKIPAGSFGDVMARLDWMQAIVRGGLIRSSEEEIALIERLRTDITELFSYAAGR